MRIDERYDIEFARASDIQAHMPRLRDLASRCDRVVEFGVRTGVSTIALLAGRPWQMFSHDVDPFSLAETLRDEVAIATDFRFVRSSDLDIPPVRGVDLLFIDTIHTERQLAAELALHGEGARKIALHDTTTFGRVGEDGGPGLLPAVEEWLRSRPHWVVAENHEECNGLMVLERTS